MHEEPASEPTETQNLRRFLESDDPAKVLMGLSMAKGTGVDESLLGLVLALSVYGEDEKINEVAEEVFAQNAPTDLGDFLVLFRTDSKAAVQRLVDHGSAIVPTLVAVLENAVDRKSLRMNDRQHDFCSVVVVALDKLRDERAIQPVIRVLQHWLIGKSLSRPIPEAKTALLQFGAAAVEPLIAALEEPFDSGNYLGHMVPDVLGEIGDSRAVEPLIRRLIEQCAEKSDWHELSVAYTEALLKLADQKPFDQRSIGLLRGAGGSWTSLILARLGLADAAAIEKLVRHLWLPSLKGGETNFGDSFQAALVELGAAAVQPLLDVLPDEAFADHDDAILVLGEIGDKRAVEPLISVLNREAPYADLEDEAAYETAAWALGEIGDKRAIQPLIAAIAGMADYDREPLIAALKKLGHEVDHSDA